MCGRYQLDAEKHELEERYGMELSASFNSRFNVAPSQQMPIVTEDKLQMMNWGLPLKFGDKVVRKLINVREDSLSKPWAKRFLAQRCLIPATGYYEWKTTKEGKKPYYFAKKDHSIFSFAGLFDGVEYAIITRNASTQTSEIHNRMPIILSKEGEKEWLNSDTVELKAIRESMHLFSGELKINEISSAVNNPRNDSKSILN